MTPVEWATLLAEEARCAALPDRALELYEQALSELDGDDPVPLAADILRRMGTIRRELGESVEAELLYTRSLRIAELVESPGGQAHALNCLALMAQRKAQNAVASEYYRQAVLLARAVQDHRLIGMIEQNLGVMASIRGDLPAALNSYRASSLAFDRAGDDEGRMWVLNNIGMAYMNLGEHVASKEALEHGLDIARRVADTHMESIFLVNKAALAIQVGCLDVAAGMLDDALVLADARHDSIRRCEALKLKAILLRKSGSERRVIEILESAHDLAIEAGDTLLTAEVTRELGDAWEAVGDLPRAIGL